jgi:hypothetical protein
MRTVTLRPALFVFAGLLPAMAGCGISVDADESGRNKKVNISSPMGKVSVNANADTPPDTGLAVHSGARVLRDGNDEHENANVDIEGGFFSVKVAVARYEDPAGTDAVIDFYKKELARFGTVTECRGNLDFKDDRTPRCKFRSRDEIQLGVGTESDNHVVSVKPRGDGSEFTLVHVQTRS